MHMYGVHLLWPKYMQYLVIGVEPISLPSNLIATIKFISSSWKPWCGGGLHLLIILLIVLHLLVVLCLFLILSPLVILGPLIVLRICHSLDLCHPPPLLCGVGNLPALVVNIMYQYLVATKLVDTSIVVVAKHPKKPVKQGARWDARVG